MTTDKPPTIQLDNGEELHCSGLAMFLRALNAVPLGTARRTNIPVVEYPGDRRSDHPLPRAVTTPTVPKGNDVVVSVNFGTQGN